MVLPLHPETRFLPASLGVACLGLPAALLDRVWILGWKKPGFSCRSDTSIIVARYYMHVLYMYIIHDGGAADGRLQALFSPDLACGDGKKWFPQGT